AAGVEPVLGLQDVAHRIEPRASDPDPRGIRWRAPARALNRCCERPRVVPKIPRGEEVQPILYDGTADGESVLLLLIIRDRHANSGSILPHEVLVLDVSKRRTMQLVRAGFRYGVHQTAGELALAHVEWRDQNLILPHRFDGQRPRVHSAARDTVR